MGREAERQLKREREWERQKLKTRFNIAKAPLKMPSSVTITS